MNILFLMKNFEVGGQEVVTIELAHKFIEHGHHVVIATFKKPAQKMADRLRREVVLYTLDGFKNSEENVLKLSDLLYNDKIDIVINQWGLPYIPIKILKQVKKINKKKYNQRFKVISVYHNSPDTNARIKDVEIEIDRTSNIVKRFILRQKRNLFRFITSSSMKYVYRMSDVYQVLSPSFIDKFQKFTGIHDISKLMVQTNPVTIKSDDFVFNPAKKAKEIIYVGRIDYNQKRVYRVIDTWALLEDRFPDWRLTIVGDGESKNDIEKQVRELKLKKVSFEGFQDPLLYYKRASILMLTSEYEGFPLVLAECMSFGVVPAVYGSYFAVYDIIKDTENGFIIPCTEKGYDKLLMAEKLSWLMKSPSMYEKMALKAISTSKNYSIETIYESWNNLFNKLKENKE